MRGNPLSRLLVPAGFCLTIVLVLLAAVGTWLRPLPAEASRPRVSAAKTAPILRPVAVAATAPTSLQPVYAKTAPAALTTLPAAAPLTIHATPHIANGTMLYTASAGEPVAAVVHRFWSQTSYMTHGELESALRNANGLEKTNYLKAGQQITVPGYETTPIVERPISLPAAFEVRAVYLTGTMAGSVNGLKLVEHWRSMGGNAVVFDIKDSDGSINIPFSHPLAPHHSPAIPNLPKYVRYLHSLGLHAIARIALFRDEHIAQNHSELAVRSRRTGQPWRENGKLVWTDSSNPDVQAYNIALAKTAAAGGVDEIQFDYVRFPAEGDQADAQFHYQSDPKATRADVIAGFLERAYAQLHPMGVLVSLDVFGVMAWQRPVDLSHTGQDIVRMVRGCDVLSPMIYPSHFFGMDGYAKPGDAPAHFIGESMERFRKITANVPAGSGKPVILRPWLQAFGWRTTTYDAEYIRVQVEVAQQKGGDGFLFWNARNDYGKPMTAMAEMRAKPGHFFRGDELPNAGSAPASERAVAPVEPNGLPNPR